MDGHRRRVAVALLAVILVGSACVRATSHRGVRTTWRKGEALSLEPGVTTQADVLAALGPPSQVIDVGDRVVLYYLAEQQQTSGVVLLLYNDLDVRVTYDRAIFFFDGNGRLTEHAISEEKVPYVD